MRGRKLADASRAKAGPTTSRLTGKKKRLNRRMRSINNQACWREAQPAQLLGC
jgi:hypothetical protein